jgi:hypothetical protein
LTQVADEVVGWPDGALVSFLGLLAQEIEAIEREG